MHHEEVPRAVMGAVKGVGIAKIKTQMITRMGVQPRGRDKIKPFGRLAITLLFLGPKRARKSTNLPRFEMGESSIRAFDISL